MRLVTQEDAQPQTFFSGDMPFAARYVRLLAAEGGCR
jgi:hypothetical protein